VKLLATSDLHLGRHASLPFEESDADLTASAHTWHRIVDLAIREDVDAVLLAGDLVDQANRFYEAASTLEKGIGRLVDARIPVVMVSGNHDREVLPEVIQRLQVEKEPSTVEPTVHLLGRNGRWETRTITVRNGEQLQVTGWSFPENEPRYRRNPMATYEAPPQSGLVSVGLLHCDVNQSDSEYAPVSSADFNGSGLDYWVLGHIHKPVVWRESAPEVFYPGAPHPFDAGEPEAGTVRIIDTAGSTAVVPVAPIRYATLAYEVTDGPESRMRGEFQDELRALVEDPAIRSDALQLLVLTVRCRGTVSALNRFMEVQGEHEGEFIPVLADLRAVIRKWEVEPQAETDLEKLAENSNPAGLLASWILQIDRKQAAGLAAEGEGTGKAGGENGGQTGIGTSGRDSSHAGELTDSPESALVDDQNGAARAEYPEELRDLLDAFREEYREFAAHGVFKPAVDGGKVPAEPTDEMIESLFRTRAMTLLQTLITQAEDRK